MTASCQHLPRHVGAPCPVLTTPRPWPENAEPTTEQLAEWLSKATMAELVEYARIAQDTARRAGQCFVMNHAHLIQQQAAELTRLRLLERRVLEQTQAAPADQVAADQRSLALLYAPHIDSRQ